VVDLAEHVADREASERARVTLVIEVSFEVVVVGRIGR
jgi:hypothetical protein